MAWKDNTEISEEASKYVGDFILSITQAMRTQLMEAILQLEPVPLTKERLEPIQRRPGIYQLFLDGKSVYIGKADSNLTDRLAIHRRKFSGRYDAKSVQGTPLVDRMSFRCMYINADIDSLGPEKMLIHQFKRDGDAPWNNTGIGNKDPGRNRDMSVVKLTHFDRMFPINLDVVITPQAPVSQKIVVPICDLQDALASLKVAMPFLFRYGQSNPNKKLLKSIRVDNDTIDGVSRTVREWLSWVADQLPTGWSITALPGYVIAYEESDFEKYASRTQAWHSHGGSHTVATHTPEFTAGKVEESDDEEGDENG